MDTGLAGKVVVITGASGGIGSAIARRMAAEGARLVLHYRTGRERVASLAAGLGVESLLVRGELAREADARRLMTSAVRRFGRIDTLVANAGSWAPESACIADISLRRWRATMDAVLTTAFLSVREFARVARAQGRGNVVLVASTAGIFGEAGHADYAAAKSAMAQGLVRTLKNEFARLAPHTADYCGGPRERGVPGVDGGAAQRGQAFGCRDRAEGDGDDGAAPGREADRKSVV